MKKMILSLAIATMLAGPLSAAVLDSEKTKIDVQTLVSGLKHPWGMAFLPDGRMLVTERNGGLLLISADGSSKTALTGLPAIEAKGQGGLLDIALSPDFARDNRVFFSFSEPGDGGSSTAVAKCPSISKATTVRRSTATRKVNYRWRCTSTGRVSCNIRCRGCTYSYKVILGSIALATVSIAGYKYNRIVAYGVITMRGIRCRWAGRFCQ